MSRPDIDLDIEHQERERVIQYVYQRYGRRRAAMVANVVCFRGRSAVRDVGKALGLPLAQVDRLAQRLQWHPSVEMPDPDQADGDVPREISGRVGRDLLELSREIVDFPRHLGIHTGGMIISSRPLDASVPIEPATMEGRSVAQWDKDDCADAGLLKIDLLGLGMLTLVQRAFRLIEATAWPASGAGGFHVRRPQGLRRGLRGRHHWLIPGGKAAPRCTCCRRRGRGASTTW